MDGNRTRVGFIKYLNAWPLYRCAAKPGAAGTEASDNSGDFFEPFSSGDREITTGTPSEINKLLAEEKLDIATISAAHYLRNREDYQLLGCGGISASGPVMSVIMLSACRTPGPGLKKILITDESESSAELLKIVLQEFHGLSGIHYESGSVGSKNSAEFIRSKEFDAVLVIGDEALKMRDDSVAAEGLFSYDLSAAWNGFTSMPFVFGVVAARKDFYFGKNQQCVNFAAEMKKCVAAFNSDRRRFAGLAAEKSAIAAETLNQYYSLLDYGFGFEHTAGLEEFDRRMKKLSSASLAL